MRGGTPGAPSALRGSAHGQIGVDRTCSPGRWKRLIDCDAGAGADCCSRCLSRVAGQSLRCLPPGQLDRTKSIRGPDLKYAGTPGTSVSSVQKLETMKSSMQLMHAISDVGVAIQVGRDSSFLASLLSTCISRQYLGGQQTQVHILPAKLVRQLSGLRMAKLPPLHPPPLPAPSRGCPARTRWWSVHSCR